MIPLLAYSRERDVEKNSTKDCVDVCGGWGVCVCVCVCGGVELYHNYILETKPQN